MARQRFPQVLAAAAAVVAVLVVALVVGVLVLGGGHDHHAPVRAVAPTNAPLAVRGIVLADGQVNIDAGPAPAHTPAKRWTAPVRCGSDCALATDGTRALVVEQASGGGHQVVALDGATGHVAWTTPLDRVGRVSQAKVVGRTVLVEGEDPGQTQTVTVALDLASGAVRWRRVGAWEAFVVDDALLLTEHVSDVVSTTTAIDPESGAERWHVDGVPVGVCLGSVVLARADALAVVDGRTGRSRWVASTTVAAVATCQGGVVVVPSGDGVTAHDLMTGRRRWHAAVAGTVTAVSGAAGVVTVATASGTVALGLAHGDHRWTVAAPGGGPVATDLLEVGQGRAITYVPEASHLLSLADGAFVGAPLPDEGLTVRASDALLSVEPADHRVHAVDVASFVERWQFVVPADAQRLAVGGRRVFVLADGALTAYA